MARIYNDKVNQQVAPSGGRITARQNEREQGNAAFQRDIDQYQMTGDLQSRPQPTQKVFLPRVANWRDETYKDFSSLRSGDIGLGDVAREIPGTAARQLEGIGNVFSPALTNFVKTNFSIFGEGLAFALDKNVREQYQAGNLDILPTITSTTQKDLVKYTVAAGIETAVFKSFPHLRQQAIFKNAGIGALQGVGFAIGEGLAKDKTPEEIIDSLATYGVGGAVISVITPYLIPILRSEATNLPAQLKKMSQELFSDVKTSVKNAPENVAQARDNLYVKLATRNGKKTSIPVTNVGSRTRVPVQIKNEAYESFLRQQGYEPVYVSPDDIPTINWEPEIPRRDTSGMLDVDTMDAPNVSSPAYREPGDALEPYLRPEDMPVIEFGEPAPPRVDSDLPTIDVEAALPGGQELYVDASGLTKLQQQTFVSEVNALMDRGFGPQQAQRRALAIARNQDGAYTEMVPVEAGVPANTTTKVTPKANPVRGNTASSVGNDFRYESVDQGAQPVRRETVREEVTLDDVEVVVPQQVTRGTTGDSGGGSGIRNQEPIGQGPEYYSRLAQRMSDELEGLTPEQRQDLGMTTYNRAVMREQTALASRLIREDIERAIRIATGEEEANEILSNVVAMTLARHAAEIGDPQLAIRVARAASLRSTRAGQEISALRFRGDEFEDPILAIQDIMTARQIAIGKKQGGGLSQVSTKTQNEAFEAVKKRTVKEVNEVIKGSKLKMAEAQKAIDDIIC